jgi:hypothetical protein
MLMLTGGQPHCTAPATGKVVQDDARNLAALAHTRAITNEEPRACGSHAQKFAGRGRRLCIAELNWLAMGGEPITPHARQVQPKETMGGP